MPLVKNGELAEDRFVDVSGAGAGSAEVLPEGALIVGLEQWQAFRDTLIARGTPLGLRLASHQSPEVVAGDLDRFDVVALEFPKFRDGRAYSYARLLRERYGYRKELRAVGDVLLEQLHFMLRTGFDAFEIDADDAVGAYRAAAADFSVWYQPTGDGRPTAMQLRHARRAGRRG